MEEFVEKLVNLMENEDLELQNKSYKTALSLAVATGNVKIVKIMLKKNKFLLEIPGLHGIMPLHEAAISAKTDMVRYLYDKSKNRTTGSWNHENRGWALQQCVEADIFDVAVKIVNDHPALISNKRLFGEVLLLLAKKTNSLKGKEPHTILRIIKKIEGESDGLKLLRIILEKIDKMFKNEINEILQGPSLEIREGQHKKTTYPSQLLFIAAKNSNTRFITKFMQLHPDVVVNVDDKGRSIFHIAVKHHDLEIYNLLHEIGWMKKQQIIRMQDVEGNNLLHLVAKNRKPKPFAKTPTIAIQIQHELLWFKEVKQMIPPAYRQMKNKPGETPQDLFIKKYDRLVKEGEKWVKSTTPNLIVPIIFAFIAAYTLYIGYRNRNTGFPMFYQKPAFIVFMIADAISLIFSSTSVLIFLSILTSSHVERHLLEWLPKSKCLVLQHFPYLL